MSFKVGHFYSIEVNLKHRPKKHVLCIAINNAAVFYVNTEERSCAQAVPLPNHAYWKYPWHDCFIDVAHTRPCELGQLLKELGQLHCDDIDSVIEAVNQATTLTPEQQEEIISNLQGYRYENCGEEADP